MGWQLSGQLVENCSCNVFCPCWFGVQEFMIMDQGWCGGLFALRIDDGEADGVGLADRKIALAVHFPGPTMFDGNATGRVYIDDAATDEQRAALDAISHGTKGGPMEAIAGLVSNWLPTETAAIDFREDGDNVSVTVGESGELSSRLLRDPEGSEFTMRGGGFIGMFGLEQAEIAPSHGGGWRDSELPMEFETKSGARGAFTWAG